MEGARAVKLAAAAANANAPLRLAPTAAVRMTPACALARNRQRVAGSAATSAVRARAARPAVRALAAGGSSCGGCCASGVCTTPSNSALRRERHCLQCVPRLARMLDARQVRLRRDLVSQRLLRRRRQVPNAVRRQLWSGGRRVLGLRQRPGVLRGQVRLQRDVVPHRLLQRKHVHHRGNELCVRFDRFGLSDLRHPSALQRRQLRLRRHLVPQRLL